MWNLSAVEDLEIDEITREIFEKYKYALTYIGVDFEREDVQDAVASCAYGMEAAFQSTICYWLWKKNNHQQFDYPSAFLIKALAQQWKPINWSDQYLDNPNFKGSCQRWWEEAAVRWGRELRSELIADVAETIGGEEYILLRSGKTLSLNTAKVWGWQRVLKYALTKEVIN